GRRGWARTTPTVRRRGFAMLDLQQAMEAVRKGSLAGRAAVPYGGSRGTPRNPAKDTVGVKSAAEILDDIAPQHMKEKSMSWAEAVNRAAQSPMFTEALGRERATAAMAQGRRHAEEFGPSYAPGFQGG